MHSDMKFDGQKIRELRAAQHLDQEALAARAGLTQSTVSRIEAGTQPTLNTAYALADALGVGVDALFVDERGDAPFRGRAA